METANVIREDEPSARLNASISCRASGLKKTRKIRASNKYRGGVRTCAQVHLTSPPHPALAAPLLTPPPGVSHPRLAYVASSTASSTGVSAVNVVVDAVVVVLIDVSLGD